ncbi:MAG: hypothetical protein M3371_09105 [Acidobacteriota bacterium]|nr:hypothetical protein [Acidobacteriota bacterium]
MIITDMSKGGPTSSALFHGHHFDRVIVILCIRWYIAFKLNYRAIKQHGTPERITDDSYPTHAAMNEVKDAEVLLRTRRCG